MTEQDKKFYTWNELYDRAMGKGHWEAELQAKDTARNQIENYAYEKFGIDIANADCPEDEIDNFLWKNPRFDSFDIDGNMTALYDKPIYREVV